MLVRPVSGTPLVSPLPESNTSPTLRFGLGAAPSLVTNAASVSLALRLGVASSSLPAWPPSAAWLLLLYCASARAHYVLRVLPAEQTRAFAAEHDRSLLHCLANLLQFERPDLLPDTAASIAQLAFRHGGLGLRKRRADSLPSLAVRAPDVFAALLPQLESPQPDSASARALCDARQRLFDLGFDPPPWASVTREGPPEP